jgi:hypothetical protein
MQEISSINLWYLQAIDTFERTLNTDSFFNQKAF